LDVAYRSLWRGTHALVGEHLPLGEGRGEGGHQSLPAVVSAAGVKTTLLTDELIVAEHPLAAPFTERIHLNLANGAAIAPSLEKTRLAQFFAAAVDRLRRAHEPFLLWLHTRGLGWPWDAPLDFRNQFGEEEDPPPPDSAEVPRRMLPEDLDPDELWGYAQAYAGQVCLLDTCLGALLDELQNLPETSRPMFSMMSLRGFPMGEHRRLGPIDEALYGELAHVPWLIRWPDGFGAAARSQALVQPADLAPTLLDWSGLPLTGANRGGRSLLPVVRGDVEAVRDRAVSVAGDEKSIRTPAWHLRLPSVGSEKTAAELFVKPDDRFEVNEVSNRVPEVVAGLNEALGQFEAAAKAGSIEQLASLNDELRHGLE
jgi:hypothetical protein